MRQGTSLPNERLERIAVGSGKSLQRPPGFLPDDPLTLYVDEPELFSCGPMRPVASDPDRRAIDLQEWFAAHVAAGAVGDDGGHVRDTGTGCGDKVIDVADVRIVVLDTNHPDGDYQGSVGTAQLEWLDDTPRRGRRRAREVRDHRQPPRFGIARQRARRTTPIVTSADALLDVVHRHPCVIAWLVGHRHIHRIEPRPGWRRWLLGDLDRLDHRLAVAGTRGRGRRTHRRLVEIVTTLLDHGAPDGSLAALHRDVARRFAGTNAAAMSGAPADGTLA